MVQYLLGVTAIWLVSLALFDIFLKKENYHNYNRFFLLFTFLLGGLLPLWQWLSGTNIYPSLDRVVIPRLGLIQWIVPIYITGVAVAISLLAIDIIKLLILYRTGNKSKQDGWTIVETGNEHPPFSYLDILFVTDKGLYSMDEWTMLTTHEKQHSLLLHLIDMLIMQCGRIIFWFHPLVYIYNNRLVLVHEYQADRGSAGEPAEYGRFLVEQAVLQAAPVLSQSFNRSPIKNRIVMLSKNGSPLTGKANLKKLMLVLPLTIFALFFFTKNSYSENKMKPANTVWKKQVARQIDLPVKEIEQKNRLKDVSPDSTLLEMMVSAVTSGKVTAYSNFDHDFSTKLNKEEFNKIFETRTDTMVLTDPVTGKETTKVIHLDFNFRGIHKYRILEEWTFNPSTGKTDIEILGINPIRDVYGPDGNFRGVQGTFWLHYKDALPIIERYELYHPDNTVGSHIWNDYFASDGPRAIQK